MKLLAVDTSSNSPSLAVLNSGVFFTAGSEGGAASASRTFILLDGVLKFAGLELQDLTGLAIGAGPGSFTGLRISFAAFRTLAWSLKIPLVPVDSLKALAWPYRNLERALAVVLPARRGFVYQAAYLHGGTLQQTEFLSLTEARERIISLGDEALLLGRPEVLELNQEVLKHAPGPEAVDVLKIALGDFEAGSFPELESVLPLYLRPSDAEAALLDEKT